MMELQPRTQPSSQRTCYFQSLHAKLAEDEGLHEQYMLRVMHTVTGAKTAL
jgi:hypothetical protein